MEKASEELRFEDAARYRDQIRLLEKDLVRGKLISEDPLDRDAVGLWREGNTTQFVVVFVRGGSLFDKMEYSFKDALGDYKTALGEFVEQFYGEERFIPDEILLPLKFEGIEVLSEWLSERKGSRVKVTVPRRGSRLKLVEFAKMNAEESLRSKLRARKGKLAVLEGIKRMLRLRKIPLRVECFDISNIQGDMAVGSMIRFEEGEPVKNKYRRFRIKTVSGTNDYAMMYEVLTRRYRRVIREGDELPELILIDGGKGQLSIAHGVLGELGIRDKVDLISIAKARGEGEEIDKIYIPQRKDPVVFSSNREELLLLMRIRNEAHRFAITYHKKLRRKRAFESALDSIPGIGKERKKALLTHFRSVAEIKKATVDEIARVSGINREIAQRLLCYLD